MVPHWVPAPASASWLSNRPLATKVEEFGLLGLEAGEPVEHVDKFEQLAGPRRATSGRG